MNFDSLLQIIGDDPVFESSLLFAGNVDPRYIRLQLARWITSGRIYQLRRGLYSIAPPYQKRKPHPFLLANRLQRSSYVSLQSALAHYGLIPETVNSIVSVTTGRPERVETPLGIFEFRHIKSNLLFGYQMTDLGDQEALLATPEKALLDLVYLQPGGESLKYLQALRFQNLNRLNLDQLKQKSEAFASPKMREVAKNILQLIREESTNYEEL